MATQLGKVNTLTNEQMVDLLKVKGKFGLTDERIECAADGCVGQDNEPYLDSMDVRPVSASCRCNGGSVVDRGEVQDGEYESLVQAITDQIMAAAKG